MSLPTEPNPSPIKIVALINIPFTAIVVVLLAGKKMPCERGGRMQGLRVFCVRNIYLNHHLDLAAIDATFRRRVATVGFIPFSHKMFCTLTHIRAEAHQSAGC